MAATETSPATIAALLAGDRVHLRVKAADKDRLIRALVAKLPDVGLSEDAETVVDAILARERLLSTGVGDGVALPHAKVKEIDHTSVIFATTAQPIDFDAFDGEPVRLVFLMVGTTDASQGHIRILGRVSRLLNKPGVRTALIEASSVSDFLAVIEKAEEALGEY